MLWLSHNSYKLHYSNLQFTCISKALYNTSFLETLHKYTFRYSCIDNYRTVSRYYEAYM